MIRTLLLTLTLTLYTASAHGVVVAFGDFTPPDPDTWDSSTQPSIGITGSGLLGVSGGSALSTGDTVIGALTGATGVARVNSAGSSWRVSGSLTVAALGGGAVLIEDGALLSVTGGLTIDANTDGDGFISLRNGAMLALAGDADASIAEFLSLIDGSAAVLYYDAQLGFSNPITEGTRGVDYSLEYAATGELSGFTVLTVATLANLSGDYNGDGVVDAADYTVWRDTLGDSVAAGSGADGDESGVVDQGDYVVWRDNYGLSAGVGVESSAAPEPGGLWCSLIAALLLLSRLPQATVVPLPGGGRPGLRKYWGEGGCLLVLLESSEPPGKQLAQEQVEVLPTHVIPAQAGI